MSNSVEASDKVMMEGWKQIWNKMFKSNPNGKLVLFITKKKENERFLARKKTVENAHIVNAYGRYKQFEY